jgi:hypothetical protein
MVMDSNPGVRLGGAEVMDQDVKMAEAVEIAKRADVVIAVVGLNADWETEGYDRKTLALPGRTDELIGKVLEVNPNTVVVTQSVSGVGVRFGSSWTDVVCTLGLVYNASMGRFGPCHPPFVVLGQRNGRRDRRRAVREEKPIGQVVADVPQETGRYLCTWTFPF